ncbi:MAG: hypothetical protein NC819_02690 [Candidatus Omnitrophica bacterium]|nr:hypothetical protein [Candidatus Omnitrophota bacterium]
MLELGNRERHVLSGLGVQILVIALLVFPYTQALRHVNYERELYLKSKEQAARGKRQVEMAGGKPDLEQLWKELLEPWEGSLPTAEELPVWAERLESFGRNRFALGSLQMKVGVAPERTVKIQTADKEGVEIPLYSLELEGIGTTRHLMDYVESLKRSDMKILLILESMKIKLLDPQKVSPVGFRLKWLIATLSDAGRKKGDSQPVYQVPERLQVDWAAKQEPFLSVLAGRDLVNVPVPQKDQFQLTQIMWDPENPVCILNGAERRPGDWIGDYRLVWIAPQGVLLQQAEEELFLPFSPALG